MRARLRSLVSRRPTLSALGVGLLAPLVCVAIFVGWRTELANAAVAVVLVAVVGACALFRRLAGASAALVAAVAFDVFFTRPYGSFEITSPRDVQTMVALFVVGVALSELVEGVRKVRQRALDDERSVTLIHEAAIRCASDDVDGAREFVSTTLCEVLTLRACRFERRGPEHLAEITASGDVVHVGLRWPVDDLGLPGPELSLPVVRAGIRRGQFVLTPTPGLAVPLQRRLVAHTLATLVSSLKDG